LSAEEFTAAVIEAPDTRPHRYTVLEHLALDKHKMRERVDDYVAAFTR
jgi:glycerol-1-phosphate dehydrogenase [NAD(P)+]